MFSSDLACGGIVLLYRLCRDARLHRDSERQGEREKEGGREGGRERERDVLASHCFASLETPFPEHFRLEGTPLSRGYEKN